jgi:hypothetical protein
VDHKVLVLAELLGVFVCFGAAVVTLIVFAQAAMRVTAPKARKAPAAPTLLDEARFARLEQAVDAIAVEVERISEAQRFSAKLMHERLPSPAERSES